MKNYVPYSGKVTHKGKRVRNPSPFVISSENYRVETLKKNAAKKTKKNVWSCIYCKSTFDEDEENDIVSKWISCDGEACDNKTHLHCVPKRHLNQINFEYDSDADVDFICEVCYAQADEA